MTTFSIKLQGAAELEKKLAVLGTKVGRKIVRRAVRSGAKLIQKAGKTYAKSNVGGQMGGLLSKNLVVRAFKRQRRGSYGVSVRLKPGVNEFVHTTKDGKRYYIPFAIEYGHAFAGRGGGKNKDVPAIPFIRPAEDANKEKALKTINNEVDREIKKIWRGK